MQKVEELLSDYSHIFHDNPRRNHHAHLPLITANHRNIFNDLKNVACQHDTLTTVIYCAVLYSPAGSSHYAEFSAYGITTVCTLELIDYEAIFDFA